MQSAQCQNQVEIEQQNNQAINNAGVVQNPTSSGAQSLQKREKQRPETWNKIEQQIFFNALRQNGKNFESITQYFNARQKRYKMDEMGPTSGVQRSKEQIRHFYYRTWHKIIKYIEIPKNLGSNSTNNESNKEASDKTGQNSSYCINVSNCSLRDIQVKCLIAFNVLMNNKSYCWNKKTAVKLVELVNQGCTTVREKGKLARLRMPICKVSSKSIQNTESNTSNQLPQTLSVNLEPNSDAAFCKVHRLAQNPFLSIRVQPQQAIKFLIDFLENKWKVQKNTTVEKSQPDEQISSKNGASSKSDLSNEFDENSSEQLKSKANTSLGERIILFPHESHQLVNIDLASSEGEMARGYEYEPLVTEANQQKTSTDFSDITINCNDPLGIDDCAMVPEDIATSNVKQNQNKNANQTSSTTPNSSNNQAQKQAEFSIDIIKSGLTWSNASISISNGTSKEKKELTFSQLYLALNRPNFVKLKYDWIISSSGAGELDQCDSSGQSSNNLSSLSSQFQLSHHQSQKQQQFYFDAVASTASSFLNEMQKTKTDAANTQAMSNSNTASNEKSTNLANSNSTPSGSPTNQSSSSAHFKIPIRPASAQVTHQNSPNSQRSIAFLQPMSASNQGAIIPLDTVLARISEEQANKTKLILSDLGSKRRSRQRKPVMVVNSGHSPRAMLPKLNIMNALNSAPESIINDSAVAQNIVFSGPVAAVARQVFNNNEQGSVLQQQQQQQQSNKQTVQQMPSSVQMLQDESSSMQESYSNLLTKILPTSITINEESNQSKLQQKANNSDVVLIEGSGSGVINKNMNGEETSNTLTDISLLDMSINNADSLFGSAVKMSSERFQQQPNEIVLRTINQKSLNFSTELRKVVTSFDNILNTETASNCFSPSESSKIIKGFTNLLNENSLNNVVNSAPIEKNVQQDQQQQQMVLGLTNQQQNPTNSQFNSNPTTSLVHKKSDIMIEWTDSMNDVSLTGCFLNDVQSPEKTNKNVALINENSRDSIFFNMDTITDILPQGVNRFDDSILTNANTIENIQGQSKT